MFSSTTLSTIIDIKGLYFTDIDCGNVPTLNNGNFVLNNLTDTTYGAKAAVKCDAGYLASVDVITCTINGTWTHAICRDIGKQVFHDH